MVRHCLCISLEAMLETGKYSTIDETAAAAEKISDSYVSRVLRLRQVRRSGEKRPPENDFRPSPRRVSQQVCPENPRKPATQRGDRSGGERYSHGNWRTGCPPYIRPALIEQGRDSST
jgi:hypothetical protein